MILDRVLLSGLRRAMGFRCDGQPQLDYVRPEDEGLRGAPFFFYSGKWRLHGVRVFPLGTPKGQLTFFHGIGAGACAYMKEICYFARQGFVVDAYDNTGCMTSEGTGIGNIAQSFKDQEAFYRYLDKDEMSRGMKRYAVGHSWGGLTAFGALKPQYHVAKVISISGPISVLGLLLEQEPRLTKMESTLEKALRRGYGEDGVFDARDILAKTVAPVLYVAGGADPIVRPEKNYEVLKSRLASRPNLEYLFLPESAHNPYWTLESQRYFFEVLQKKKALDSRFENPLSLDLKLWNQDDPEVMKAMADFLLS